MGKRPNVRNEVLDTYVYARAAAHLMGLDNPSKKWSSFENKLTKSSEDKSQKTIKTPNKTTTDI